MNAEGVTENKFVDVEGNGPSSGPRDLPAKRYRTPETRHGLTDVPADGLRTMLSILLFSIAIRKWRLDETECPFRLFHTVTYKTTQEGVDVQTSRIEVANNSMQFHMIRCR